jgi:hypothetical protein
MYRARAERRFSPALAAYHWEGSTPKQCNVRNISSTGAYLLTSERWKIGDSIRLTLQRKGAVKHEPHNWFSVPAKAVRWDQNGIGVAFELPLGADVRLWQNSLNSNEDPSEPEHVVRAFRTASAAAFLSRISPASAEETTRLLRDGLSSYRVAAATEVIIHAEEMLSLEADASRKTAHPRLVKRIVQDASWAEVDWIQHLWAGLLVGSCSVGNPDESNLPFIHQLSQLAIAHARIFAAACSRAKKFMSAPGEVSARPLSFSADEMMRIAGSHDLIKIDRDLEHLADLGLLVAETH